MLDPRVSSSCQLVTWEFLQDAGKDTMLGGSFTSGALRDCILPSQRHMHQTRVSVWARNFEVPGPGLGKGVRLLGLGIGNQVCVSRDNMPEMVP